MISKLKPSLYLDSFLVHSNVNSSKMSTWSQKVGRHIDVRIDPCTHHLTMKFASLWPEWTWVGPSRLTESIIQAQETFFWAFAKDMCHYNATQAFPWPMIHSMTLLWTMICALNVRSESVMSRRRLIYKKNKYAGFCKRIQTTKQTKPKARFCDVKF